MMFRATTALLCAAAWIALSIPTAQADLATSSQAVVVTFATADGSTFRAVLEQPADIAAVEAALAGDGYAGIPNGTLAYGDGRINDPHDWHMVDTALVDITIELCDGTAAMVDEALAYWVETVGRFCPWSATVLAVDPVTPPGDADDDDGDPAGTLPATGYGSAGGAHGVTFAFLIGAISLGAVAAGAAWRPRRRPS